MKHNWNISVIWNISSGLSLTHEIKVSGNNEKLATYRHLLFACDNGEFVSRLARCNGIGECIDNSDEEGCLQGDFEYSYFGNFKK